LFIAIIGSLILSWNTLWVWQLSKLESSPKRLLRVRPPTYYEINKIQIGAFALVYGKNEELKQLQSFFDDPVLVLIDGTESRYWDASQIFIESKFRDLTIAPGSVLPASGTVALSCHLTGPGIMLPGRPSSIRAFLNDHIGGILFGENSKTINNRFFLAMDGKSFREGSATNNDFLLNLEAWVKPASFFIRSALGSKKLDPIELLSEPNFEKCDFLGFL